MNLLHKQVQLFGKQFSVISIGLFSICMVALFIKLQLGTYNNYLIFKGVFVHTFHQTNLYASYPNEYIDVNHYGPFFCYIIAPFALMPDYVGCLLWVIVNLLVFFYAIQKINISTKHKSVLLLIVAVDLITSIQNVQFNPMLTSWILLSFILVQSKNDFWATFFIAAGFFVKIYGIVGLVFFFFSENKKTFVLSFIFWCLFCFASPMLISSSNFIVQTYIDWFHCLQEKNQQNHESMLQGITAFRFLQNGLSLSKLNEHYFLLICGLLILSPLLKIKQFKEPGFQLRYLSLVMISLVIFSSSAESATYIIAMTGVGIWFSQQHKKFLQINLVILVLTIIFSGFSTSDLFTASFKDHFIRPNAIKAAPCFFIWIILLVQLIYIDFKNKKLSDYEA